MAGIEDTDVIDLVTHDRAAAQIVLIMSETRPWGAEGVQLDQLVAKLNTYAAYALDEHFRSRHPEVGDAAIRIQVDCVDEPDEPTARVVDDAARVLDEHGITLVVNPLGPV